MKMVIDAGLEPGNTVKRWRNCKVRVVSVKLIDGFANRGRYFLKKGMTNKVGVVIEIDLIKV